MKRQRRGQGGLCRAVACALGMTRPRRGVARGQGRGGGACAAGGLSGVGAAAARFGAARQRRRGLGGMEVSCARPTHPWQGRGAAERHRACRRMPKGTTRWRVIGRRRLGRRACGQGQRAGSRRAMRRRAMCAQPRRSVARGQGRRNGGRAGWAGSSAKEGRRHEQGSALPWARGGAHTRAAPWPSEAARGRAAKWPRRRWVKEAAGCVVPWRRVDGLLHKTGVGGPRGLATRFLGGRGTPAAHKGRARSGGTTTYLSDWGRTRRRRGEVRPWRFDAVPCRAAAAV